MKRVEYFNTKEELERYYENGVPSTVLAIVQPDAETAAVLYTSSNNSPINPGQSESQGGESIQDTPWIKTTDLKQILADPKSYEFPLHLNATAAPISTNISIVTKDEEIDYVNYISAVDVNGEDVLIDVIIHDNSNGDIGSAGAIAEDIIEYGKDIYGNLWVRLTDCTLSEYSGKKGTKSKAPDYVLEGTIYAWNLGDNANGVEQITENGFYLNGNGSLGFNVNVKGGGSTGTLLSEVFGADENNYKVYIPFTDAGDAFTYSFQCTWDGENWRGSLSNAGFALVGRIGQATQYDYDSDSGKMIRNDSYCALQMHVANGALYLGDVFSETGATLDDGNGEYRIATDMWPNTKFLNNGFGVGPENLDMTGWTSGTLTFTLTVPKNLAVNYDTGYDHIDSDDGIIEIVHPCVYLKWEWNGVHDR